MANIFLVSHILLLFHFSKGLWNKPAKLEKLRKHWSYYTRNRTITNACFTQFLNDRRMVSCCFSIQKKQNSTSAKSVFYFLGDLILNVKTIMCPKWWCTSICTSIISMLCDSAYITYDVKASSPNAKAKSWKMSLCNIFR